MSTNRARQIRDWPGPPEIHIHCMDRTCVVVERVGSSIALSTVIEGYHMLPAHLTKEQARNVIAVLRQVLDDIDARGHEGGAE